ncbi:hypothetical protein C6990_05375 [Nitrosopumilus sp. b3]|uniref:AAA family ATPase n=1 Tax=Nitrosopumilus sp. b3 TaxID=2109909 RepID=UPI0015F68FF2|nr:SMC family ATPase [Nitrosopumilus sp. b3]KAF6247112.1 hypothetical protein C6990_05375 [Nitrosopumilus sp. b3]
MMLLKRIHLKNYRRYRDEDIEFPTGLTGIVGRNGSGKSTLIEAIGWCLYGNSASRTKKDQIKTTGIPESEDCSVTLEMMMGPDSVQIIRELRGKNSSGHASVFVNGNDEAHVRGMNEVSEFVAKRTGMDHVAFFTSVFAKQKELDSLSNMQPGDRKKTIMRLLRINRIDDAIGLIRNDIRGSRDKINYLQGNLKDVDELENKSQQLEEEKVKTTETIKERAEEIKRLFSEVKKKKIEFSTHEKKYRDYNKVSKELAKITTKKYSKIKEKDTIELDLKNAKLSEKRTRTIAPKVKEFESVKKEKANLDSIYGKFKEKEAFQEQHLATESKIKKQESLNKKIENNLASLKGIDKDIKKQEKAKSKLEEEKEVLTKSISGTSAKINENQVRKNELNEEFSKIQDLGENSECPTCKRPLKDHFPHVSKYFTDEISKLDEKINADSEKKNKLELELKSTTKEISELLKEIKDTEDKRTERTSLQTKLREGKRTLSTIIKEKTNLEKKLKKYSDLKYNRKHHTSINKQHTKLSKFNEEAIKLSSDIKRIPMLSKRHKASDDTISKLEHKEKEQTKKLNSIDYDETEYQKSKQALDDVKQNHTNTREEWITLKGEITNLDLQLKQITQEISEEKEKRKTIDEENKQIGSRSKLEKIMNDFRLDLISRIRPILSQRSSELFREITKGKYPSMELDDDYDIKIEDEGNSFTTDRFSGGEEDLANLCLRIAISQELAERSGGMQSNFIALDEVFGSQDEERKNNILRALSELSNQFKQILVITHVEDVKEMLPYVLTIKENSENSVKVETEGIAPLAT